MLKPVYYPLLFSFLLSTIFFGNSAWIHSKAFLAQLLIDQAWGESLETGQTKPPWPWADFWPVARLVVKSSGNKFYVLSNASGESLAFGPGHMNGSAAPATTGTSVIAAHRDTHFKFLKYIKKGDIINVQRPDGAMFDYQVSGKKVVDTRQAKLTLDPVRSEMKLVTCYPFDAVLPGQTKRLIVELVNVGDQMPGSL